jgi:ATP-dependent phosphofructokinase / diphosphate-dependent phosphofructokinase
VKRQRVCILSGGGDAPGVNAIIRGFAHAAHRLGLETFACKNGLEGLLHDAAIIPLGFDLVRGILPKGGCVLGCSTRVNPFFVPCPGGTEDHGPAVAERLRRLGIDGVAMIGGDGTMIAAARFTKLGIHCVGIPKTIDNDLAETERTTGFETAVETATHAIDALHSTAEAHARVMIVEVMGRDAGYIALHAGIAGGADVILLPEIPYRLENIVDKIREREAYGMNFTIVVASESARPDGSQPSEVEGARPGHLPRRGGAGERLRRELEAANLDHEVRVTVLGHLQRGGSPCAADRDLGTWLGAYAAELCASRSYGRRIVLQAGTLRSVPLRADRSLHKTIDPEGPLVRAARLVGITFGDRPPIR